MLPRLGKQFGVEVEVIAKSRQEYQSTAYAELALPRAPAVMINSEVIVQGRDIEEQELEKILRRHLVKK